MHEHELISKARQTDRQKTCKECMGYDITFLVYESIKHAMHENVFMWVHSQKQGV